MSRYVVHMHAIVIVDGDVHEKGPGDIDQVAQNMASRVEEMARSSEYLLDYSITPYFLPEASEASH